MYQISKCTFNLLPLSLSLSPSLKTCCFDVALLQSTPSRSTNRIGNLLQPLTLHRTGKQPKEKNPSRNQRMINNHAIGPELE